MQLKIWNVQWSQLSDAVKQNADVARQQSLLEQSKKLSLMLLDIIYRDVLTIERTYPPLPSGVPESTVGIMLNGCNVDNVLVGGPACSLGIEKGDLIVAINVCACVCA